MAAAATTLVPATPAIAAESTSSAGIGSSVLPIGIETSFEVFDRTTGETTVAFDSHKQYRSASVVKLLIALDYLEGLGEDFRVPPEDLAQLQPMLRSSDDTAASYFWVKNGWEEIVERMVAKLDLTDTAPPADRGQWGYTAISASDVVKIYRYILDDASPQVRSIIMDNLRQSTKCGNDGFDQYFGIARAAPPPWAIKQGWSGFGDAPSIPCTPANPLPPDPFDEAPVQADNAATPDVLADVSQDGIPSVSARDSTESAGPDIDVNKAAMHTTGTLGEDNDTIVVVLTLEPSNTSWDESAQRISLITKGVLGASSLDILASS
ncbi:hypothetical protein BFN03_15300 [Rhodococcus sp. WMMA185]|nr:hypothetical protein BFN03_15300 [Rhodococcus sp. WMMA185]